MLQQLLPKWLDQLGQKMNQDFKLFKNPPNHVLINEYLVNQGINPHKDGPIYEPFVMCLSILSPILITFTPDQTLKDMQPFSVLLEPRSLIIFQDTVYENYLHGILENDSFFLNEKDNIINLEQTNSKIGDNIKRETRISLTFRNVKKTMKNNLIKL